MEKNYLSYETFVEYAKMLAKRWEETEFKAEGGVIWTKIFCPGTDDEWMSIEYNGEEKSMKTYTAYVDKSAQGVLPRMKVTASEYIEV